MARHAQIQSRRLLIAIVGSAAMLLVAPSGAWAGSAHHGKNRHGNHGSHYSAASHDHASHKGHRGHGYHKGHRGHDGRHAYREHHRDRAYRHGYRQHRQHHDRYYCNPCGQYFGARDALYGHVSGHHGVPFWQLSYAIANHAFGLIFYG